MKDAVKKFEEMCRLTESWFNNFDKKISNLTENWHDDYGNRNKKLQLFSTLSPEIQANARRAGANMRNKAFEKNKAAEEMTFTIRINNGIVKKTFTELVKMLGDGVIDHKNTEIFYNNKFVILSSIPEYPTIEVAVHRYMAGKTF